MSVAIKVENLSKIYQIGEIGTGTLSRDMERWWVTKVMGKEDPFLKIGQTNNRSSKGSSDVVYSLQDINFEIEQGDAVGIIGKNGAGKSTLLKILSRITSPTTGKIQVKGRVASLLEVGTGFHPELTGRDNIYLNGAILGMRKKEINRKLDEIIDFSGVERYIDTPVKRYSSGMYVRLAFAVAAHLESEILIVDEVLAVGDAEFQKKCLGKMNDVSKSDGRTILFVSHNMLAIKTLCTKCFLLKDGCVTDFSQTNKVVDTYFSKHSERRYTYKSDDINSIIKKVSIQNDKILFDMPITVNIEIDDSGIDLNGDAIEIFFDTNEDLVLFTSVYVLKNKSNKYEFIVPSNTFNVGIFKLTVGISHKFMTWKDKVEDAVFIEVEEENRDISYMGKWDGIMRPNIEWKYLCND